MSLSLELTLSQQCTIRDIELKLPRLTRKQLESMLIDVTRQRFAYENVCTNLCKSPYLQLDLTMSQEITIRSVQLTIHKLQREILESQLMEVLRQRFHYENEFKKELKYSGHLG